MFCWMVYNMNEYVGTDVPAVAVGHVMYIFGGYYYTKPDQIRTYVFNTVTLRWTNIVMKRGNRSPERRLHTAVLIDDIVYIWGGLNKDGVPTNELCAFDVDTHRWFKPNVSGTVPRGSWDHSACVLGKAMYIFGGYKNLTIGYTNDMYKLDTTSMVWSLINTRGTLPPASSGHGTIIGTKMFYYNYYINKYYISMFDTETNCWLKTPSAPFLPEEHSSRSAFAYREELYIFGGYYHHNIGNYLWRFNPETLSWKVQGFKGKDRCRPVSDGRCCIVGDRVIFFGGGINNKLYILDLSPCLKTLCKLAVIQYDLEQSELPHNIKWELAAITTGQ